MAYITARKNATILHFLRKIAHLIAACLLLNIIYTNKVTALFQTETISLLHFATEDLIYV